MRLLIRAVEINVFLANLTLISAAHSKNLPVSMCSCFRNATVQEIGKAQMHKKQINNKREGCAIQRTK